MAKPLWGFVMKGNIYSMKQIRPLDKSISPKIIISEIGLTHVITYNLNFYTSPFCLKCFQYIPATITLDTLESFCSNIALNMYGGYNQCYDYLFYDEALYDTSRHIIYNLQIGYDWDTSGNRFPPAISGGVFSFSLNLASNSLFNSCPLSLSNHIYYDAGVPMDSIIIKQNVFFHPTDGTILFGLNNKGLTESHFDTCPNYDSTWQLIKPCNSPNYFYIPQDSPSIMFLCAQDTLWRTSDAGTTWSVAALANINCMTHIPNSDVFIAGADSGLTGLYVSKNGGSSFLRINNNPVYSLDADPATGIIYIGGSGVLLTSSDSGITTAVFDSMPGENVIGVAAMDGKIIYADSGGVYETDAPTSVPEPVLLPGNPSLSTYPNPFSGKTTISLNGFADKPTSLKIYDALGRVVSDLTPQLFPGVSQIAFDGRALPAGVYVCRMAAGAAVERKMMVVVK